MTRRISEPMIAGGHRPPLQLAAPIMYTCRMSWSFRALVMSLTLLWAVAPQLACFMPGEVLTEAEHECCKEMLDACGGTNMTHDCCRTVIRADVGIVAKSIRSAPPQLFVVGTPDEITASWLRGPHAVVAVNTH